MTAPAKLKVTLLQGTTQRIPISRRYLPFAITGDACSGYKNACTGADVLATDYVDEDYSGCSARMQMRTEIDDPVVIAELVSPVGIELAGNTLTLVFQPEDMIDKAFDTAVGQVEVTRPNGDIERHVEITFILSPEGTR